MRSGAAKTLGEVYGKSRDEGFEPENKRRIMIGICLSSGFYDAYYLQAQKARTLLVQNLTNYLKNAISCLVQLRQRQPSKLAKMPAIQSKCIGGHHDCASFNRWIASDFGADWSNRIWPTNWCAINRADERSDADMIALAALVEKMETK